MQLSICVHIYFEVNLQLFTITTICVLATPSRLTRFEDDEIESDRKQKFHFFVR